MLLVLLSLLAFSDWKHRTVSTLQLLLLGIVCIVLSLLSLELADLGVRILFNLGWILSQVLLVQLYFIFKEKRFKLIVDDKIGLGDLVFFAAITPLFAPDMFILFYLSSLFFALIAFGVARQWLSESQSATIPLVGTCAAWLVLFYTTSTFFQFEPIKFLRYAN